MSKLLPSAPVGWAKRDAWGHLDFDQAEVEPSDEDYADLAEGESFVPVYLAPQPPAEAQANGGGERKGCGGPECGCDTPSFTEPLEALRFLSGRLKYAGVSHGVAEAYARDIDAILARQPADVDGAKPLDDWHEDDGPVVWWKFPVDEPAWIGTPNDSDWPGYHTHWTPHPAVPALAAQPQGDA